MLNTCKKTQTAGFSLLELLLVVAVGAILILAGLGAYRLVSEGSATNSATNQVNTIKNQVQNLYAGQGAYGTAAGDLTETLKTMKIFPADMPSNGTGTVRNAFTGNASVAVGASPFNTFTITFTQVPTSACTKLAQLYNTTSNADFLTVKVNTATAVTSYTPAAAATDCALTALSTIIWTFK